jgi:S1-C subfamily serine protease
MSGVSSRTLLVVALSVLVLGAGLGAAAFSVLDDDGTTVVREVTVTAAEPATASQATTPIAEIYDRASKAVVEVQARVGSAVGEPRVQAQGSGFVIDRKGHVVTNQHVVAGATSFRVSFWNGQSREATLVGTDASTDLAVLKVSGERSLFAPLRFGDSSALSVGDTVLALGSPFGLEGTLTSGIVSALNRRMTAPNRYTITGTIQTDAAINHGNSGGPLLDTRGSVIGVNAQIESDSGGSDGVGFAIPSNTVRSITRQLVSKGRVEHALLGITMTAVPEGVAVTEVRPDTPADEAGLQAATSTKFVDGEEIPTGGDVIVAFEGAKVTTPTDLQAAVDRKRPGDRVEISILREGRKRTVVVTLAERP